MTVDEAQRLVSLLFSAYPQVALRDGTAAAYVRYLVDLDADAVEAAIEELILTDRALPTIASIRRHVVEGKAGLPTAIEAWAALNAHQRPGELHELAKQARELLGGSWAIRTADNPSITRAQYVKVYDELRERALADANRASRRRAGAGLR